MPEETQTQAPATEHLIDTQKEAPVETVPTDQEQTQASEPQRPEWLPEKFKTAEDLAKSYTELEKKITNRVPEQYDFSVTQEYGLDSMPDDLGKEVTDVFKKANFTYCPL